jgi:hypothetical protein
VVDISVKVYGVVGDEASGGSKGSDGKDLSGRIEDIDSKG